MSINIVVKSFIMLSGPVIHVLCFLLYPFGVLLGAKQKIENSPKIPKLSQEDTS